MLINVSSLYLFIGTFVPDVRQMLVIKRTPVAKGNSYYVTVPAKELVGDEVYIFDKEALDLYCSIKNEN